MKMMTEIYDRLSRSKEGRKVPADISLTKPFRATYTMPSTPTVTASRILMAALRFRMTMLSHTG